ncbi:MAG TPA: arginine--tRNA ligase, partial [Chromatiales bacterium]|nr:arginine--tRNA ligase [Chromatiales bacterium]
MKRFLQQLLDDALAELYRTQGLAPSHAAPCTVERTRDRRHGDFASNAALTLAKGAGLAPRELAQRIVAVLADDARLAQVAVAGPGFINFTLSPAAFQSVVPAILDAGEDYGRSGTGAGQAVQVEFVSANPTGPLHVGHGRGAAYGAAVADLLEAVGFRVHREYYVNDAGRQMDILA